MSSPLLQEADRADVKRLHALIRSLPGRTTSPDVCVAAKTPLLIWGPIRATLSFELNAYQDEVSICAGGYLSGLAAGGDSFTTLHWQLLPSGEVDRLEYIEDAEKMVPGWRPFEALVEHVDIAELLIER